MHEAYPNSVTRSVNRKKERKTKNISPVRSKGDRLGFFGRVRRAARRQLPAARRRVAAVPAKLDPPGVAKCFFEGKALNQKAESQDGFSWAIQLCQGAY